MINKSNRNIYQRYHFKKIPIEVGHRAVTNRCFSSVSSIDPSIKKRYEKNTFLVEQRFHYVKFKGVVLDNNAAPDLSIRLKYRSMFQTTFCCHECLDLLTFAIIMRVCREIGRASCRERV